MAGLISISKTLNSMFKSFSSLSVMNISKTKCVPRTSSVVCPCSCFHATSVKQDLMEFFDDKNNWAKNEVKVGRSWKKDELRIKSNSDLHKLWFVLLKEKNMLLTMEHESKEQIQLFPNPERIDKVEESMKNLEDVVRERNEAYFKLETGQTGERPVCVRTGSLGLRYNHRMAEHIIPQFMNKEWQQRHKSYAHTRDVKNFITLYREKKFLEKRKARNRERNHVIGLMKRFPNLDFEAVKEQFPSVDIEKIRYQKKTRGHRENIC
ncbi:39S ribosomal protein L47, mitochondrial [Zootermopsis nevadensis]|uniref:Large ribosomal subunit protein uL29m n=1 Tax=Zootermopsis nevadensis TaxID=136037 RepID=A0A067RFZ5_ZOONE|nr:39S ribosomal protein L47, mitochondrial [Zootermopsis nevadensis]KDR19128.1 39S ribosomal protein L47, mitochondrial [Zootermopsis nevadensis]